MDEHVSLYLKEIYMYVSRSLSFSLGRRPLFSHAKSMNRTRTLQNVTLMILLRDAEHRLHGHLRNNKMPGTQWQWQRAAGADDADGSGGKDDDYQFSLRHLGQLDHGSMQPCAPRTRIVLQVSLWKDWKVEIRTFARQTHNFVALYNSKLLCVCHILQ